MKGTSKNRFRQILSLLMVMAVSAGTMIVAPQINAKTTDIQHSAVQSANAETAPAAAVNTADPDITIRSFKSDTQGVPVGETKDVIFSAEISGDIGADDKDVKLLDDADHLIGYMLDNGENGDEAANDGVYTLKTALSSDKEKTVYYHPDAKGVCGDELMIGFYTAPDEESMEQMDAAQNEISDFVKAESFREKSDEDRVTAAGEFLDQLAEDGKIKSGSVNYDDSLMQYTYEYNTTAIGLLEIKERDERLDGSAVVSEPLDLAEQLPGSSALTNMQRHSDDLAATGSGSSCQALVLNGFEDSEFRRTYYQNLRNDWNNMGLSTTLDSYVTVSDMKNIGSSYDVVVFAMHGNVTRSYYDSAYQPILGINEKATSSNKNTYSYELTSRHSIAIASDGEYVVFPRLFTDSYSSSGLNGKLICANACCFYGSDKVARTPNYNMSNALRNIGARAVYGYHNSVESKYSRNMIKHIVEKCYNGVILTAAVNSAKSVYGNDDDWEDPSRDKYKAYPIVNPSDSSFVLRSASYETITLNATKTASITTAGNMKYYKFTPASSGKIQFYSSGSNDTLGYLYNSSMTQLAYDDDSGSDKNFKLSYNVSANTTYYLGCKFYSSTRTGSFSVTLLGSSSPSYETITLNSSKTASITTAGTMKYYKFTPTTSTQINFYSTGSSDTYGYLYNSSMSQIASNDDGGEGHNFKLTYNVSGGATYYLGCKYYSSSNTGSFTVRLEEAYENITLNSSKTASITTAGTMKYYKFTPTTSTQINFYSTGNSDTYGYLYKSSMRQIASNDDGGEGHNFKLTYNVSGGTTYYLGCKYYNSANTGSFTVRLEEAYENITLNSSKTASIDTEGGMKYYKLTPTTAVQIQFCSTGGFDTYGYLYDASMSQLASDDDSGTNRNFKLIYTLSANTTYYLGCRFYSSSAIGSFPVRLDVIDRGYMTANITTAGTMKTYSITPARDIELKYYSTGSYDTLGYIFDANGNQLTYNDDDGENRNFSITYTLRANTTYYLGCKFYNATVTGSFTIYFELTPLVDSVTRTTDGEAADEIDRTEALSADIEEISEDEIAAIGETAEEDQPADDNAAETIAQEEQTEYTENVMILSE